MELIERGIYGKKLGKEYRPIAVRKTSERLNDLFDVLFEPENWVDPPEQLKVVYENGEQYEVVYELKYARRVN